MGTKKISRLDKNQVKEQVGSYQKVDPEAVLKAGREASEEGRANNKAANEAGQNPVK